MGIKIALNGQYILRKNPAGPERFTINLYKALAQTDSQNEYLIYVSENPDKYFIDELIGKNTNFKFVVIRSALSWTHIALARQLYLDKPNIFFTPIHTVPFLIPRNVNVISMIHGLEYKSNFELPVFSLKALAFPFLLRHVTAVSKKVVVPSEATKKAIIKNGFCKDLTKLVTISEGVSGEYHPRTEGQIMDVLDKYKIRLQKYLLFVSTIQPRKNIPNLIKAFADAIKKNGSIAEYCLVIVGKLGWSFTDALEAPKKYGVEENVRFLNWVPQDDLPKLFAGAAVYVNLSFEEGFGLTVLEAEASGVPLVLSNIPAHRETGKEFPLYVDPEDINQISEALILTLTNPRDNAKLQGALKWAQSFSWENVAQKFVSLFTLSAHH